MSLPTMQKLNLDSIPLDEHGKIAKQTATMHGVAVTRVTFNPGAKWSADLKEYAGTESCQLPHVALMLKGCLAVKMDDGSEEHFNQNDVMMLPPVRIRRISRTRGTTNLTHDVDLRCKYMLISA
jgi:hypothetical protein